MTDGDDRKLILELGADESVSAGVIRAVASATEADTAPGLSDETDGVAVLDPLWSAIDPDALDALFRPRPGKPQTRGRVTFRYHGYNVTVSDNRRVILERTTDVPAAAD